MTQSPSVGWWNEVLSSAYLISNFSQVGYAVQNKKAPTEVEACSVETEITADAAVLPADTWCRDAEAAVGWWSQEWQFFSAPLAVNRAAHAKRRQYFDPRCESVLG